MSLDSVREQGSMTKITLLLMVILASIAFLASKKWAAGGVIFGSGISVLNNHAVAFIMRKAFGNAPQKAQIFLFCSYHVRFVILVIILYFVIPHTNVQFGVGTFLGFLASKISMGITVFREVKEEEQNKKNIEHSL